MRRNFVRNEGKEYLANRFMTQTKNSFSLLSNENECSKCNNFGHTAENCRLRQIKEEEKPEDICGIALHAQKEESKWYIDSGCTKHMTCDKDKFLTLKRVMGGNASFGDNGTTRIIGKGTMALKGNAKA